MELDCHSVLEIATRTDRGSWPVYNFTNKHAPLQAINAAFEAGFLQDCFLVVLAHAIARCCSMDMAFTARHLGVLGPRVVCNPETLLGSNCDWVSVGTLVAAGWIAPGPSTDR